MDKDELMIDFLIKRNTILKELKEQDELETLKESEKTLIYILRQIINDLPSKKDWLDPVVEAMAKTKITEYELKEYLTEQERKALV